MFNSNTLYQFIPGEIISLITFPGVILHELSHKVFCDKLKVKVYEVCYFRFKNPVGYVKHGPVKSYTQAFLIDVSPFIINTLVAFSIFLIAVNIQATFIKYFLYWLGVSIAMNSFPSSGDANLLWHYSKETLRSSKWALLGFPIAALIKIANLLSIVWFDLFYAIGLLILAGGIFGYSII